MSGCHVHMECHCKCHVSQNDCCIHCVPVSIDVLHTMRQTIETWQNGCEALINNLMSRLDHHETSLQRKWQANSELSQRLTTMENAIKALTDGVNEMCDHDERIHDLEKIEAEHRLIRLESY